jgi:hypothetical protein
VNGQFFSTSDPRLGEKPPILKVHFAQSGKKKKNVTDLLIQSLKKTHVSKKGYDPYTKNSRHEYLS